MMVPGPLPPGLQPPPPAEALGFVQFTVAIRFLMARDEFGADQHIGIRIVDAGGHHMGDMNGALNVALGASEAPPGTLFGNLFAVPMGTAPPHYGQYSVDITVNGRLLKSLPFSILQSGPPG